MNQISHIDLRMSPNECVGYQLLIIDFTQMLIDVQTRKKLQSIMFQAR